MVKSCRVGQQQRAKARMSTSWATASGLCKRLDYRQLAERCLATSWCGCSTMKWTTSLQAVCACKTSSWLSNLREVQQRLTHRFRSYTRAMQMVPHYANYAGTYALVFARVRILGHVLLVVIRRCFHISDAFDVHFRIEAVSTQMKNTGIVHHVARLSLVSWNRCIVAI